jgi:hypothetical protein
MALHQSVSHFNGAKISRMPDFIAVFKMVENSIVKIAVGV